MNESLPQWYETDLYPSDVICLSQISESCELSYSALRSYATHRREHKWLGPMPAPAAKIANRKVWLRSDIEAWLRPLEVPKWRRSKGTMGAVHSALRAASVHHPKDEVH